MPATPTYLLDAQPIEIERLLFMAQLLAPEVRASCERAGLRPGGRAIDVGCGPVGALPVLAEMVGPGGAVVGIDADATTVATASTVVEQLGLSNVRLVAGDINEVELNALGAAGSFDLAFSRLTLMHQADPAATLARVAELLRPGGSLIAFDLLERPVVEPPSPALERGWELIVEGMRRVGAHPDTSRRYPQLALSAGLEVVSQRGVFFPIPPAAAVGETATLLRAAQGGLLQHNVATQDEIDDVLARLGADLDTLTFATTPFALELIARKP